MSRPVATHEDLSRRNDVKVGSDRGFGFVFAGFCALVAATHLWHGRLAFWPWIGAAVAFACSAVFFPRLLRPMNLAWFRLGLLLHRIVTPVVLGLMFYAVFTPIGAWMRVISKRPLHLRFDRNAASYWIPRKPPGPSPESFNDQF